MILIGRVPKFCVTLGLATSFHCTFWTGLFSNPPSTVNPVGAELFSEVCFGVSSIVSDSPPSPVPSCPCLPATGLSVIQRKRQTLSKIAPSVKEHARLTNIELVNKLKKHTPDCCFFFFFFFITGSSLLLESKTHDTTPVVPHLCCEGSCLLSLSALLFFFTSCCTVSTSGWCCLCSVKLSCCFSFAFSCSLARRS